MKPTIGIAVLILAMSLTSCQKELDWKCVCQTSTTPMTYYIEKKTKKNAKQDCDSRVVGIAKSCELEK